MAPRGRARAIGRGPLSEVKPTHSDQPPMAVSGTSQPDERPRVRSAVVPEPDSSGICLVGSELVLADDTSIL